MTLKNTHYTLYNSLHAVLIFMNILFMMVHMELWHHSRAQLLEYEIYIDRKHVPYM